MESATFKIVGLGCSCEGSIVEKRVKKLKGVGDFAFNTFTNRLRVSFDPSAVTIANIQKSVAKAGVKAVLLQDSVTDAKEPQTFGGAVDGCCGPQPNRTPNDSGCC